MSTTTDSLGRSHRVVASAHVPRAASTKSVSTKSVSMKSVSTTSAPIMTGREKPARSGPLAFWFVPEPRTRPMRVALAEGGYLGVTLMVGGMAVLMGLYWRQLTDVVSASLLAILTGLFIGAGLAVAGGPRGLPSLRVAKVSARSHVAGALFALASGSAFAVVLILAHDHAWFAAAAIGLIVAVFGYTLLPTVSGLLASTALSVVLAVSTVDELMRPTPLSVGAALVGVGLLLGLFSALGLIRQAELGLSLGAVIALVGAQQPLARADTVMWAYAMSFALGVACVALYVDRPVNTLLIVGVLGTGLAVLEATWDLTRGALGLVAILVASGAALISTSGVGLYLWRSRSERVNDGAKVGRDWH
jgi:hypothetical protein